MQIYNYGYMPTEDMELYDSMPKWVRDRLKNITPGDGDMDDILFKVSFGGVEHHLRKLEYEDKRDHREAFDVVITGKITTTNR